MSQKQTAIICVKNLISGYANSQVLFGVDFEAKAQEITVIVGPNGSGKSTLLKSIFGLCNVYSGEIIYDTQNITGWHHTTWRGKKLHICLK